MIDRVIPATGILVGVDGNPLTSQAVRWAAREAGRRSTPLDLVQVLPPSERPPSEGRAPAGRAAALLDHAREVASTVAPDVPVRLSVVDGVVGPALAATAARAQLLVIGAPTARGLADLTVGRTAAHLMGRAACPVVLVPLREDGESAVGSVLVGVDGSPEAQGAVAFGADLADRWRTSLEVAVVVRRHGSDDEETQHRYLAEAVAGTGARYPDLVVREVVRRGSAAEELLRGARQGAGLLVVGSRGRSVVGGALIGSTSQEVVRFAPCPVAVLSPESSAGWAHPDRVHAVDSR